MDLAESRLSYREHEWHVIDTDRQDRPPLTDRPRGVSPHDSDSPMARDSCGNPGRFYFDFELLAAGFDPGRGGQLNTLNEPWHGHPAGALVMTVYVSDDSEIGVRSLYCVADEHFDQAS